MYFISKPLASTLVAFCLLSVSGCTSQPEQNNHTQFNNVPLNQFLESAPKNIATTLPASPWGANAQITAGTSYYAASGKTCRPLLVTLPAGSQEEHIACKTQNGEWQLTRPFGSHKL